MAKRNDKDLSGERRGMLLLMEHLPNMRSMTREDLGALMQALIDHVLGNEPDENDLPREAKLLFGYIRSSVDRMEAEYRRKSHKPDSGKPPAAEAPQECRKDAAETEQKDSKSAALNNNQYSITQYLNTHTSKESVFVFGEVREGFQKWLDKLEEKNLSISDEGIQKQMDKLETLSTGDPGLAVEILRKATEGAYRGFFKVGKQKPKEPGFDWGIKPSGGGESL